jgi:hypothetical protein
MRTTVTIDEDVATKLQAEMRKQRSRNFKEILNDVLRRGLLVRRELAASKPFEVRARRMGKMEGLTTITWLSYLNTLKAPSTNDPQQTRTCSSMPIK